MVPGLPRLRFIAALLPLMMSTAGSAAPVPATRNAGGKATVLKSLSVLKNADLDFSDLVVTAAGTAVIDPAAGSLTTTGGVNRMGSAAHAAAFTGTGSKNSVVLIRLPKNPIALTRVGGTETMSVSGWTLDGSTNRRIPPGNAFIFAVGATLNVAAGQMDGTYTGTFDVTVQYP